MTPRLEDAKLIARALNTCAPRRVRAQGPAPQREPMGLCLEALSFDSAGQAGMRLKYRTSPFLRYKPLHPPQSTTKGSEARPRSPKVTVMENVRTSFSLVEKADETFRTTLSEGEPTIR